MSNWELCNLFCAPRSRLLNMLAVASGFVITESRVDCKLSIGFQLKSFHIDSAIVGLDFHFERTTRAPGWTRPPSNATKVRLAVLRLATWIN